MKISVSLPEDDVHFVDDYAEQEGITTRSAVVHRAIRLLRSASLGHAYELAWEEWSATGEAAIWEPAVADAIDR